MKGFRITFKIVNFSNEFKFIDFKCACQMVNELESQGLEYKVEHYN